MENFDIPTLALFIIGFLADIAVAALLGILFFYTLRLTGKEHAHLKAVFAGIFIWVGITGLSTRTGISRIDFTDPSTILSFLATDVLFAQLLTYFILYFGKDYLPLRQYPGLDLDEE